MSKQLKISIVTPSFNQGQFLRECIESVVNQKYDNFEHIVIDGGSSDTTVAVLAEFEHLTWVSEKDRGQSHATNKGLLAASGDIIGWLNSDDYYVNGAFEVVNDIFTCNPDLMLLYGAAHIVDERSKYLFTKYPPHVTFESMIRKGHSLILQPSVFFRRCLVDEIGLMDESIRLGMDYDYWLRILKKYDSLCTNNIFSYYRINNNGGTISQRRKDIKSGLDICKKHVDKPPLFLYVNIGIKFLYYTFPVMSERFNSLIYLIKSLKSKRK